MKVIYIIRKFLHFFNLEPELENQDLVYDEINKGIVFKGTNLWILFFAIIIASVGLNMNSIPVIIGAMLISPLMGPINGMGYSIATYDFELFKKSIKNFTFAIIVGLAGSTFYFTLSPISTAYSELLARTSPTIYDVLIALFGGLAGIVAISSKQKGNVIPGVAIATALMPPLCTSGYGLATGKFNFFFGAIYLFTINTIFIAIASVLVSQLLKFPIRTVIDENKKKKINRIISLVIFIVLLPSIFFGYKLVKQEEFLQKANRYISNVSLLEGIYLLKSEIDPSENKIVLIYGGREISDNTKKEIIRRANDFNISNSNIIIKEGLTLTQDDSNVELLKLKEKIISLNSLLDKKNYEIDSLLNKQKLGKTLLYELKTIYPELYGCFYSESLFVNDVTDKSDIISVIILSSKKLLNNNEKEKIKSFLMKRLNKDYVKVYFEK